MTIFVDANGFKMPDLTALGLLDQAGLLAGTIRREQPRNGLADHFGRGVAEHALRADIPTDDAALQIFADNGIVRRLHNSCQKRSCLFRALALSDVAQIRSEEKTATLQRHRRDGQFRRKFAPISAQRWQFDSPAQHGSVASRHKTGQPLDMRRAQTLWNDYLGYGLANDLLSAITKSGFRRRIEVHDPSGLIHREHTVDSGLEDCALARFTFAQC